MGMKMVHADHGHAAAVHPEPDGHELLGVGGGQGHVQQVGHQCLAGGKHLVRLGVQVHDHAEIAAQLVGQDVQRSLEDAGQGRDRPRLVPEQVRLVPQGHEIIQHGHGSLDQGHVLAIGGGLSGAEISDETRGSHTLYKKAVGSSIS